MDVASDLRDLFVERRADGGFSFGDGGHGSLGDERGRGSAEEGADGGAKHAKGERRRDGEGWAATGEAEGREGGGRVSADRLSRLLPRSSSFLDGRDEVETACSRIKRLPESRSSVLKRGLDLLCRRVPTGSEKGEDPENNPSNRYLNEHPKTPSSI